MYIKKKKKITTTKLQLIQMYYTIDKQKILNEFMIFQLKRV